MDEQNYMRTVPEALYAKAIGKQVMDFVRSGDPKKFAEQADSEAVLILEKIRAILDDLSLDDPECFQKIEAIVDVFHAAGISTVRHDW